MRLGSNASNNKSLLRTHNIENATLEAVRLFCHLALSPFQAGALAADEQFGSLIRKN